MTDDSATISHLSVAMATDDITQTTWENTTPSSFSHVSFYYHCVTIFIGVVGTATNGLVLYALVASKQHKKHPIIANQNALDLFCSIFLILTFTVKLCNIQLKGGLGYWLCIMILSEFFVALGMFGSIISIAAITIERYLKVVHSAWSTKWLRPWVVYSAMAFAWLAPVIINIPTLLETSAVIDGVCYAYRLYKNAETQTVVIIWYIASFYILMIFIFIFCYGRILVVIRRQARVMASHNAVQTFFAICRLPHMLLTVYLVFGKPSSNYEMLDNVTESTRLTTYLYTALNPFIYAIKFDPVKKILKDMIPNCNKTYHTSEAMGTRMSSREPRY